MTNIISTFQLAGLHCESCQKITEKRIKKISGVREAAADVQTGELIITGDRQISNQEVVTALEGTGYQVR